MRSRVPSPVRAYPRTPAWGLQAPESLSGLPRSHCSPVMTDSRSGIKCSSSIHRDTTPTLEAKAEPDLTGSSQEAVGKLAGHMPKPEVQSWLGRDVWEQLCFWKCKSLCLPQKSSEKLSMFRPTREKERGLLKIQTKFKVIK